MRSIFARDSLGRGSDLRDGGGVGKRASLSSSVVIEPSRGWRSLGISDLWTHRELLYFLTWRDIKVRYKQTAFGAGWAVLQPLVTMLIFTIVFGRLARIPSDGAPYPLFALAALVPWTFFANSVTLGSNSVVQTPDLVTKIYFPRLLMPLASVLGALVDAAIAFLLLLVMIFFYGMSLRPETLLLPLLFLLVLVTALGVTFFLAALNVQYRDIRYALPFLVQMWLFATPVVYPSSLAPEPWRTVLGLNPMAGVVEGFRWALLDSAPAPGLLLLTSSAASILLFAGGLVYFRRAEDKFADVI